MAASLPLAERNKPFASASSEANKLDDDNKIK